MKFFNSLSLLVTIASTAFAVRVPNADTPLFYLVSTSTSPAPNLLVCSFLPLLKGQSITRALTAVALEWRCCFLSGSPHRKWTACQIVLLPGEVNRPRSCRYSQYLQTIHWRHLRLDWVQHLRSSRFHPRLNYEQVCSVSELPNSVEHGKQPVRCKTGLQLSGRLLCLWS